ncbi:hypothetical protein [Yinghuangia sp. YIM S09857]|uniref:hypothetical protein n=1 Tax=Yinghuangia sp. YIM S09857 TaxID=3436929 RepID=UPI003F5380DA
MRATRTLAASVPLGLAAAFAAPGAAHAVDAGVEYTCQVPVAGATKAVVALSLTASPANPGAGETVTFAWKAEPVAQLAGPVAYDANSIQVSAVLVLSGATTATVQLSGPRTNAAVPAGSPLPLGEMTGTATVGADGQTVVTPGKLVVDVQRQPRPISVACEPVNPAPLLTLESAADGAEGADGAAGDDDSDGTVLPIALGGGAVVLVAAGAGVWMMRRRAATRT